MNGRARLDARNLGIQSSILQMGAIASEMIRLAVDATLAGDGDGAQRVIDMDDQVDALEQEVVRSIIHCVGLDAPVANDLLLLMGSLAVVGEIEHVGDDAVKLARRAVKLAGHFPVEMKLALNRIAEEAGRMFASALHLYVDFDGELAQSIIKSDKEADSQYTEARNRVFDLIRRDPGETEHLVRTIEAFHALEHIADHSVEIARHLRLQHSATSPR